MDGMLSQDEINALLGGMNNSDGADDGASETASEAAAPMSSDIDESLLTDMEKDAVGEVANISMGTSATTLYSLVNRKVDITTPVVTLANLDTVIADYPKPCVFISIKYTEGLDGSNILVLKEHDVKVITDLMMGGDGTNTDGELGELHLSAISEAMNQMMGSSATSLSSMLGKKIDISPPDATLVDLFELRDQGQLAGFLSGTFVKVAFRMQIDELVDSTIMQLYPIDFAKSIYETVMSTQGGGAAEPEPAPAPTPAPAPAPQPQMQMPQPDMSGQGMGAMDMSQMQMGMNPMQMGMNPMMMGMNPMMMGMNPMMMGQQNVNVAPAQFQSFNRDVSGMQNSENIGLIRDVPLEVTVELGRTSKSIAEILEFAPGTIIELDKIAGEPIDVLVNGKFVARGEVVVIEESFGVRVTEIIK